MRSPFSAIRNHIGNSNFYLARKWKDIVGLYAQNKISRNEEGGYTAVTKAKKDRRGMIYDDLTETGKYS